MTLDEQAVAIAQRNGYDDGMVKYMTMVDMYRGMPQDLRAAYGQGYRRGRREIRAIGHALDYVADTGAAVYTVGDDGMAGVA